MWWSQSVKIYIREKRKIGYLTKSLVWAIQESYKHSGVLSERSGSPERRLPSWSCGWMKYSSLEMIMLNLKYWKKCLLLISNQGSGIIEILLRYGICTIQRGCICYPKEICYRPSQGNKLLGCRAAKTPMESNVNSNQPCFKKIVEEISTND